MTRSFIDVFGTEPLAVGSAPGRVNLLGEHTDYNDGFVLPLALHARTTVAIGWSSDERSIIHSEQLGREVTFLPGNLPDDLFARYIFGCLQEASPGPFPIKPVRVHVDSTVPIGVGLSSSAALEVATLRALDILLRTHSNPVTVAQRAQRAESLYAGVQCGIMDQMAASLGDETHALFLDTRSLESRLVPLPKETQVLVLDSGVSRSLASTPFNRRRRECTEACALLGVASLRDVAWLEEIEALANPWRMRARHVFLENQRVLAAVLTADPGELGALMNESHASLRDDFQVSVDRLDQLVSLLQSHPAVYGARLTGAGFGGACVALCQRSETSEVSDSVLRQYRDGGGDGRELARCPG